MHSCPPSIVCLLATLYVVNSSAGVTTDGSTGIPLNIDGPNILIPHQLGRLAGANLFHSFQQFELETGDVATFTGPSDIDNVISRVTGGSLSTIDGRLVSAIEGADFYFLNPAGVVFGPDASIDVPAGLYLGTAGQLHFADGTILATSYPDRGGFSTAPPEAFGFVGGSGHVSFNGNRSLYSFAEGETISISASHVKLNNLEMSATNGEIRISAMGESQSQLAIAGPAAPTANGSLELNGVVLSSSGDGAGAIVIAAGDGIVTNGSRIEAINEGDSNPTGRIDWQGGSLTIAGSLLSTASRCRTGGETCYGRGGFFTARLGGLLKLERGGEINSDAFTAGDGGDIHIHAQDLLIDGGDSNNPIKFSGIRSMARSGSSGGSSGQITVDIVDHAVVQDGGAISAVTAASGNAGDLRISAGTMQIGRGGVITSQANRFSSGGNAGTVEVKVNGLLAMDSDGVIESSTLSSGHAGSVVVTAGNLLIDGREGSAFTGIAAQTEGLVSGDGGDVAVTVTGSTTLRDGGSISSSTLSHGNAGNVQLYTTNLSTSGNGTFIGSLSGYEAAGDAGSVEITVQGRAELNDGAVISSSTFAQGAGGEVTVRAAELLIDRAIISSQSNPFNQNGSQGGDAGDLHIEIEGLLHLRREGVVSATTHTDGAGGAIKLAAGELLIDGAGSRFQTGIGSESANGRGAAGPISVTISGNALIKDGGTISSTTHSTGSGGRIEVVSDNMTIDGKESPYVTGIAAATHGDGDGGLIEVDTAGLMTIRSGGGITGGTTANGSAGRVHISAGELKIVGVGNSAPTGITNQANDGSGNGGEIVVEVDREIELIDGGVISAGTYAGGRGGQINLSTDRLVIDGGIAARATGLYSAAATGATGAVGDISVAARTIELSRNGSISIGNRGAGTFEDRQRQIVIRTGSLKLVDGGRVTTESHGKAAAGVIDISAWSDLSLVRSEITTSANEGDGGSIGIDSPLVWLERGVVTTSVKGDRGDGGDIAIDARNLVMRDGFIQANTTALDGRGGAILIDVEELLSEGGELEVGGEQRQQYKPGRSVIQAAAPDGVDGTIQITAPELDASSGLVNLQTSYADDDPLLKGLCAEAKSRGSGQMVLGRRGGFPWRAGEPLVPQLAKSTNSRLQAANRERYQLRSEVDCL